MPDDEPEHREQDEDSSGARAFSQLQKNELAEIAERGGRQQMNPEERGRFDQDLDEGALAFTGPIALRKPSAPEGKRLAVLGRKCHELADEILTLEKKAL